jgi:hypothetical protein
MRTLRSLRIALALPLALAACSEDPARSTGGAADTSSDTQADTTLVDTGADSAVDSGSADTSSEDTALQDTAPDGSADTASEDTAPDGSADADTSTEDTSPPSTAIVISELMKDPCAVSDGVGEWFEVTNVSAAPYDLRGVVITDDGSDRHTIAGADPIIVAPGATFLLAASGDPAVNGGITPDYV